MGKQDMRLTLICATAALSAATPALAQDSGGVSAGITAGTLGIGPEIAYRFSNTLGVRGNVTFFGLGRNVESDGIDYDGDLKLRSGGVMLDLHPFGNGFRVSAGARVNSNKVRLKARPSDDVEVGDETYTPEEIGTLSGTVRANDVAPTLTIGWAGGKTRGLKFGIEAGVMFHGSPKVRNLRATGLLASDPDFQASLREEEQEVEKDLDQFKIYPIVQLSIGYRF